MRCRFYCCWCCYYTTARVNAAQIFAVGVRVALPFLLLLVPLLHYGEGKRCSNFAVGVGVALPFLLLLVLLLHYGEGKCCTNFRRWCRRCDAVLLLLKLLLHYGEGQCSPNFRRWCRRYHAVFNSANAAITLRRGSMLLKFSPLV